MQNDPAPTIKALLKAEKPYQSISVFTKGLTIKDISDITHFLGKNKGYPIKKSMENRPPEVDQRTLGRLGEILGLETGWWSQRLMGEKPWLIMVNHG